jgi:membrane protein required for colicin V production
MTIFDYFVLFIIVCSVIVGALRGLIKEILLLMSWIIAIVVANKYSEDIIQFLPDIFPGNVARLIVSFLVLFFSIRLLIACLGIALDMLIKASNLRVLDHSLGVFLGLARGVLLVVIIVIVCETTTIPKQSFWHHALFSRLVETTAHKITPYLPGFLLRYLRF